jgi:predicted transcriptional regulator of viral defense system
MYGISTGGRAELAAVIRPGQPLVTLEDAARVLGIDNTAAAKKLARWARNGWLRRVRRGLYLVVPVEAAAPGSWSADPLYVANAVWTPCYFTGWTAAQHWELTEQVFRTTVLKTTQRVRANEQRLLDHDYLVIHAQEVELGWGLKSIWLHGERIHVADRARTVIDVLDAPWLGGGIRSAADMLRAYLDADNPRDTLIDYGDRLGNGAVFKRLGYLVEALKLDAPDLIDASLRRTTPGVPRLDPRAPASGPVARRWGLQINSMFPSEGAS